MTRMHLRSRPLVACAPVQKLNRRAAIRLARVKSDTRDTLRKALDELPSDVEAPRTPEQDLGLLNAVIEVMDMPGKRVTTEVRRACCGHDS